MRKTLDTGFFLDFRLQSELQKCSRKCANKGGNASRITRNHTKSHEESITQHRICDTKFNFFQLVIFSSYNVIHSTNPEIFLSGLFYYEAQPTRNSPEDCEL